MRRSRVRIPSPPLFKPSLGGPGLLLTAAWVGGRVLLDVAALVDAKVDAVGVVVIEASLLAEGRAAMRQLAPRLAGTEEYEIIAVKVAS